MSACGVYNFCPFRGILCNTCKSSFDTYENRSIKSVLKRHVARTSSRSHPGVEDDSASGVELHYLIIDIALTDKIIALVKKHARCLRQPGKTATQVALYLFGDTIESGIRNVCIVCKEVAHSKEGSVCNSCGPEYSAVVPESYVYIIPKIGKKLISLEKSLDPVDKENAYSRLYIKLFQKHGMHSTEDATPPTKRMLDFGSETMASNYLSSDTSDSLFGISDPVYTGPTLAEDRLMWNIDNDELVKNVNLMSESVSDQEVTDKKRQLYAFEKGSFHQSGLSCGTLMEYTTELNFDNIAMTHFDGSWNDTVKYLHSLVEPRAGELEYCVELCATYLFDNLHLNLSEVRPELKAKICVVSQYSRRSELRQIKHLVDEKFRAKDGVDNGVEDYPEADEAAMMNEILYKILKIQDTDNAETFRKTLGTLQPSTLVRYKGTAVKYCLFLVRVLQREKNETFDHSLFKYASDSVEKRAIALQKGASYIQGLVFTSMELTKAPTYSDSVLVGTSSLPNLFSRASTLIVTGSFDENRPYVRVGSPHQCHSTISQLMYFLRMSFCKAMHHAASTNNVELQTLIPDVRIFCDSKMIHELVSVATIAKKYEKKVKTGVEPAECARSGGMDAEIDTFVVRNKASSKQTKITKLEMQNCVRSSFAEIDEHFSVILEPLMGKELICTKIADDSEYRLVLTNENWSQFHAALFYRRVRMTEPRLSFDVLDGVLKEGDYSSRCLDGPVRSHPYVRMLSSNYYMTVNETYSDEDGTVRPIPVEVSIPSSTIAEALFSVLSTPAGMQGNISVESTGIQPSYQRRFCIAHKEIIENIILIMSMSLRGQPRLSEILKWRVGETNLAGNSLNESQVLVRCSPNGTFPCVLAAFFASLKSGGGDSCQSPLLFLAPELGRRLGMVMSVVRYSLVLYIKRTQMDLVVDNGAKNADDQKLSAFAMSHCVASCATRFVYNINIGCTPVVAKEVGDMDARYQIRRERGLNLETGSLTSAQFRKVIARLSLVNDEKIQSRVSREATDGFNHSRQTHLMEYTSVVQVPGGCESFIEVDHGRRLDVAMQEFVGISGWNFSGNSNDAFEEMDETTSLPGQEGYRILRVFNKELAHAFVQLAGNGSWGSRNSQKTILTEILSGTRDSILVYGCGEGKTLAVWAACGYVFVRRLANMSAGERQNVLINHMHSAKPDWTAIRVKNQAKYLLENSRVNDLFDYVLRDKNPIPSNVVVLVATPFKALQNAMIEELKGITCCQNNVKKLCVETSDDFVEDIRQRVSRGPLGMEKVAIWVATSAFLVGETGTTAIKNAVTSGVVFNLIQDEAHVVVTEGNWARQNVEIRNLPLWYVPRVGLTGTLQKELGTSLGKMMFSRIGCIDGFAVARSQNLVSAHPNNPEENAVSRKNFLELKGMCRSPSTVADHVMYTVVEVTGINEAFDEKLAESVISSLVQCRNKTLGPVKVERVLLLCATRAEAEAVMNFAIQCPSLGPNECALLMGGMDDGALTTFHQKWTNGGAYLGISTSCGSVGLNNQRCNVTVWMPNMYGIQTLYQGASRAGRKKQQSLSIYIKSKARIRYLGRRPVRRDLQYLGIMGAEISIPSVARALSVESMLPYINTGSDKKCRRLVLQEEMDGVILGDQKVVRFCCDVCNPVEGSAFRNILNSYYQPTVHCITPHHAGVARPAGNPIGIQNVSSPVKMASFRLASDMIHADIQEAVGIAEDKREAITTIQSWLQAYHINTGHCWWHYCVHNCQHHPPNESQVFRQSTCRTSFQKFVGFGAGGRLCFYCGGDCPSGCTLPKKPKMANSVCTRCFLGHSIYQHGVFQCHGDKLFGLVLWAIRSNDGYKKVKDGYDTLYPAEDTVGAFPKQVPFSNGPVTPELRSAWNESLNWIVANQDNNVKFWSACITVLGDVNF